MFASGVELWMVEHVGGEFTINNVYSNTVPVDDELGNIEEGKDSRE